MCLVMYFKDLYENSLSLVLCVHMFACFSVFLLMFSFLQEIYIYLWRNQAGYILQNIK